MMRKKRRNKKTILTIGILLVLIICMAVGDFWLREEFNTRKKGIFTLEKEEKSIKVKIEQLNEEEQVLQEKLNQKQEEKQAAAEEKDQNKERELLGMDSVKNAIMSQVSDKNQLGENWEIYVLRLFDGAHESIGEGKRTAASLIKLYIMGAVYDDYDNLCMVNGKEKVDALLHSMITVSDNESANTLIKMLGKGDAAAGRDAVNIYCKKNGYKDSSMGRMLLETDTDQENYTSAEDCGKFLENVYKKAVEHAEDMMNLLKQQERTGKIPAGVPQEIETANKTGELDNVENDAAIILDEKNPYILCIMSEKLSNPSIARETIIDISKTVYETVNEE